MRYNNLILLVILMLLLAACATNPVTGERGLHLVSESKELEIGKQQYGPSRQMQGGDYKADPELTRYVSQVGRRLAKASDRELPYEFVVLNSSIPNAWALPGGKIALNRGLLLELDTEAELAAVLGHEVVHSAARHGAEGMERGMLLQGAVMVAGIATRDSDYAALAVGGSTLAANLINQKYGRDAEREADLYGMKYMAKAGYDPAAAISLQQTFVRLNKEGRQDWLAGLFASHPPSQERVENNKKTLKEFDNNSGELGRARYQRAIAHLQKTKGAYAAYDEGVKALRKGDLKQAHRLARKALRIEPNEAKFYALAGDVNYMRDDYTVALRSYDKALQLNPEYFAFYLQRGKVKEKLGDMTGAKKDISKSARLLPNADSYNMLGKLALREGNTAHAKRYFQRAAGSKSAAGAEALRSLTKLDLAENPGRYLKSSLSLNRRGDVLAHISNPTHLPVRDVRLMIRYRDGTGRIRELTRSVPGSIAAGKKVRFNTGLGPVKDPSALSGVEVSVDRARILK